jgi:hypothetical protein
MPDELPFELPAVRRKKLTVDFDGGNQSSDAGLLLLREPPAIPEASHSPISSMTFACCTRAERRGRVSTGMGDRLRLDAAWSHEGREGPQDRPRVCLSGVGGGAVAHRRADPRRTWGAGPASAPHRRVIR